MKIQIYEQKGFMSFMRGAIFKAFKPFKNKWVIIGTSYQKDALKETYGALKDYSLIVCYD